MAVCWDEGRSTVQEVVLGKEPTDGRAAGSVVFGSKMDEVPARNVSLAAEATLSTGDTVDIWSHSDMIYNMLHFLAYHLGMSPDSSTASHRCDRCGQRTEKDTQS